MGRRVIILAAVLGIAAALYWNDKRPQTPKQHAGNLVQFTVTDLNGQTLNSASLRDKVLLVDFWATWCVPCESEIPHLVAWQSKYAAQGLQVVGISMDDTSAPVKSYAEKHKIDYPVAMADEKMIATFGGVLGLPANILIGRDGKQIVKHVGVTDINLLQQEVEKAIAAK